MHEASPFRRGEFLCDALEAEPSFCEPAVGAIEVALDLRRGDIHAVEVAVGIAIGKRSQGFRGIGKGADGGLLHLLQAAFRAACVRDDVLLAELACEGDEVFGNTQDLVDALLAAEVDSIAVEGFLENRCGLAWIAGCIV